MLPDVGSLIGLAHSDSLWFGLERGGGITTSFSGRKCGSNFVVLRYKFDGRYDRVYLFCIKKAIVLWLYPDELEGRWSVLSSIK